MRALKGFGFGAFWGLRSNLFLKMFGVQGFGFRVYCFERCSGLGRLWVVLLSRLLLGVSGYL